MQHDNVAGFFFARVVQGGPKIHLFSAPYKGAGAKKIFSVFENRPKSPHAKQALAFFHFRKVGTFSRYPDSLTNPGLPVSTFAQRLLNPGADVQINIGTSTGSRRVCPCPLPMLADLTPLPPGPSVAPENAVVVPVKVAVAIIHLPTLLPPVPPASLLTMLHPPGGLSIYQMALISPAGYPGSAFPACGFSKNTKPAT